MKIGTMVSLNENVAEKIRDVKKYGLQSFQLVCWNMEMFNDENAETVRRTADECGVELTALWCGWEARPCGTLLTDTIPWGLCRQIPF